MAQESWPPRPSSASQTTTTGGARHRAQRERDLPSRLPCPQQLQHELHAHFLPHIQGWEQTFSASFVAPFKVAPFKNSNGGPTVGPESATTARLQASKQQRHTFYQGRETAHARLPCSAPFVAPYPFKNSLWCVLCGGLVIGYPEAVAYLHMISHHRPMCCTEHVPPAHRSVTFTH